MDRIAALRAFVAQQPEQPFPRYALALEHKKLGQLAEARAAFAELRSHFPDYVPAYLQAGGVLAELGERQEAEQVYRDGIIRARTQGDGHACGELEGALARLSESE
jgi:predicted Zn-dependent protease